ncbi:MAG TPA: FAD-dependent oxidoreductase [Candidatus Dormibacteraeota bacterium]
MRFHATVVVVGAGAIGLATALQLSRGGIADVLVVDMRPAQGMGSTGRANGGVRAQFATSINVAFSQYTIGHLRDLDSATGGQVGFRAIGYLFMTGSDAGAAALRAACDLQTAMGLPVEWLTSDGVAALAPFVHTGGLRAATFCATDGIIDPHGVASAFCEAGRRRGVTYLFDLQVRGIDRDAHRAVVHCNGLDVDADWVVNAAGPAARDIAAMVGVTLPVAPYRRNLVCTEPIAGVPDSIPMCVDMDTGVLIRREAGGILIGYSDPESPSTTDTDFEPAFLEAIAARVGARFPFLEGAPINARKCWAGLYPETPDHNAIIDAPSEAPWFIQCAGFGGHGIMHSLAAGQAVTELIRDGRCTTFDIRPFRLDRFQQGDLTVETVVL